jgi:hypothetical protein
LLLLSASSLRRIVIGYKPIYSLLLGSDLIDSLSRLYYPSPIGIVKGVPRGSSNIRRFTIGVLYRRDSLVEAY